MSNNVYLESLDDYCQNKLDLLLNNYSFLFKNNIKKGDTVFIKPNWIAPNSRVDTNEWKSVITNPNLISSIIKQVIFSLNCQGKIIIADGPQTDSSFEKLKTHMYLDEWLGLCKSNGIDFALIDLREHEWNEVGDVIIERKKLNGDPNGSIEYNLKGYSEFNNQKVSIKGYYGADYNTLETNTAHSNGNHRYKISKSAIIADVFINIPKLKTHKKTGITCSLKNLVGINTYKNYLPHYMEGVPSEGGDQYPNDLLKNKIERLLLKYFKLSTLKYINFPKVLIFLKKIGNKIFGSTNDTIRGGNWYGNNTVWRMVLDLNKIFFYGNIFGEVENNKIPKKYITIVDGIVSGEGNGPESPIPKIFNKLILGTCPVAVDCVAAKIMGFDYKKIPMLYNAFNINLLPLVDYTYSDITILQLSKNIEPIKINNLVFNDIFLPPNGWIGHIEKSLFDD